MCLCRDCVDQQHQRRRRKGGAEQQLGRDSGLHPRSHCNGAQAPLQQESPAPHAHLPRTSSGTDVTARCRPRPQPSVGPAHSWPRLLLRLLQLEEERSSQSESSKPHRLH